MSFSGNELDCTGHGTCNAAIHECTCHPGWMSKACDVPDCPGLNCSGHGVCNATLDPPRCTDCVRGWMGKGCDEPCVNGTQTPPDSGFCQCHPCFAGKGCDSECSGHGTCDGVTCKCNVGYRGDKCQFDGCPGKEHDCSLHGSCNSAEHDCICLPG